MLGVAIVRGSGPGSVLIGEPSVPVTDVAGKFEMPLASLVKGKGHIIYPSG